MTLQGIKTCHLAEWTGQESGAKGNGGHCTIFYTLFAKMNNILRYIQTQQCIMFCITTKIYNNKQPGAPSGSKQY